MKSSPCITAAEKKNKKRILSPAISETSSESQSEDHMARARRRSRSSTAEDRGIKKTVYCHRKFDLLLDNVVLMFEY